MEDNFRNTDGSPADTSEILEGLNDRLSLVEGGSMSWIEDPPGSGLYNFPGSGDFPNG